MSFIAAPRTRRPSPLASVLVAIVGGVVLFLLAASLVTGSYQLLYAGRIFPGVSIAGLDLSNMQPEQATAALSQRLTYPKSGRIVLRYDDRVWTATPADLGLVFDLGTSVQHAYDLGRSGGPFVSLTIQLNAWQGGLDLSPVVIFDQRAAHTYLQNIADQIDQPVVEADLHLNGTEVVYTPGQVGRQVDVDATLKSLAAQLESFKDGEIPLIIEEKSPAVQEASTQAEILRQVLRAPLELVVSDAQPGESGPWTIDPDLLAGLLVIEREQSASGWEYQISVNPQSLEQFLTQIAPQVNRSSQNARFYFDDNTRQLIKVESARVGRTLDIAATREAIGRGILQGEHSIPLVLALDEPEVRDDATAESLGITGLVSSYTTYFRGSSAARIQNIQTAASRFYGLLVPPNTTFSMAEALGDVSLENGYAEALIIYNNQTITGVGGGVCQVSTTLFRTAFFGGYPILERHEHAYRVYYYEQTENGLDSGLAGLDATVYVPLVDLKFTNDRPYWLLMETYLDVEDKNLTWKFYSGDDGRTVDWQNMGLRNVVPAPDPLFEENADLAPGTCQQMDWPGDGADITVTRSVTRNGQRLTLDGDTIRTHYSAWQAVYQYGPGTDDPAALAAQGLCSH